MLKGSVDKKVTEYEAYVLLIGTIIRHAIADYQCLRRKKALGIPIKRVDFLNYESAKQFLFFGGCEKFLDNSELCGMINMRRIREVARGNVWIVNMAQGGGA